MNQVLSSVVVFSLLPAFAVAHEHNHLTVDTVSGAPGDKIVIRAGFLPGESAFTLQDGRLLHDGDIAVYDAPDQLPPGGETGGWYAGDLLLLTSDFYLATGRLDGGSFQWELSSAVAVDGGPSVAAGWGRFESAGYLLTADSRAADRQGRSFDTGLGGHDHAQGYTFEAAGLYDVTLIAWDANGVYADSDPVTVRVLVGGMPPCEADVNDDGFLDFFDYLDFVDAFEAGDAAADFNDDGFVDFFDYADFVAAFEAGC